MSRKNKAVSFNTTDPHDKALIEHAERINPLTGKPQNFSKYVKGLIEEDMKREQNGDSNAPAGHTIIESPRYDPEEEYTLEVKDAMNSFL